MIGRPKVGMNFRAGDVVRHVDSGVVGDVIGYSTAYDLCYKVRWRGRRTPVTVHQKFLALVGDTAPAITGSED